MGNTFSRKKSLRDLLIQIENEILKQEYEYNEIVNFSVFYSTFWFSILFVPLVAYLSYILEINFVLAICFILLFLVLLMIVDICDLYS